MDKIVSKQFSGGVVNASGLKCTACLIVFALWGCDSGGTELVETFRVPDRIALANVPDNSLLSATASIDGRSVYRMEFDNLFNEASVSVSFPGLALESHEIAVKFQYFFGGEDVDIAIATLIYDPEVEVGVVAFSESDYEWPDNDNDGVNNLDEIINGTF